LPFGLNLDVSARYLTRIPKSFATAEVPRYFTFDSRLAWNIRKLELAIVGQNLWRKKHAEFGVLSIPRSVYAKAAVRF
jgi:hypothetical protein